MKDKACVVLFSGGQDSTTCLFWARNRFHNVHLLTFDYGQRNARELEAACRIAQALKLTQHTITVPEDSIGSSALSAASSLKVDETPNPHNLPNTFVPGRNLLFLLLAASKFYALEVHDFVLGCSQADYSGYPDCREDTLKAMEKALSLGLDRSIALHTPLLHLDKKSTVELAVSLDALSMLALSHTCYNNAYPPCGTCLACKLRQKGFDEAGIKDPLLGDG